MRKRLIAVTLSCLLLILCSSFAQANVTLTSSSDLKKLGIDFNTFHIVCFAPNGQSIFGYRKNPPKQISQGNIHTFFNITLSKQGKITKVRRYTLRIPRVEQACYTPDGNAVVIITMSGASYVKLDLASGKANTVVEHVPDQPGFRAHPGVLQLSGNKMLTTGFFYDAEDKMGPQCLAELDPNKTGAEAFTKITDIQGMLKKVRYETMVFPDEDFGYIGSFNGKKYTMYRWNGHGEELKVFDEGADLYGFWGKNHRLLYGIKRGSQSYDLMLYDSKTDTKIPIIEGNPQPINYLFLSDDGKTAIANIVDKSSLRTNLIFAREEDNWEPKEIKGLHRSVSFGEIRISADGKRMMMYNDKGLRIIDIEE